MVVSAFTQSVSALLAKFGVVAPDIRVQGLTLDSRLVNHNMAFVAIKGHARDGRDFIPQAISLGARVILAEADHQDEHGTVTMRDQSVIISLFGLPSILSALAAAFYDYPANKLATVAVTGTNGKTSVVQLITQMKHALGTRSASIGTLGSGIYEPQANTLAQTEAANTTPDAITLQYQLAEFAQQEVRHVAFEASSHALVQGRLAQVKTDVAIFTNLTRDHLDYHGDMEAYAKAKRSLLNQSGLKSVILNRNDAESEAWDNAADASIERVWTGIEQSAPTLPEHRYSFATNVKYHPNGCRFRLETSWGEQDVNIPLLGEFNIANLLSAVACLLVEGERFERVVKVLEDVRPVIGRMEVFTFADKANVVVDYAHTPDALEQALKAVRKHTNQDVWCVFGCGGDRDKGKRPLMAAAAEKMADHIVITTDNSRSETPESIAADIKTGLLLPSAAYEEPDRELALRYCLTQAKPEDMILMAGKGHETYQIINNEHKDYDERAMIARLQRECSQ